MNNDELKDFWEWVFDGKVEFGMVGDELVVYRRTTFNYADGEWNLSDPVTLTLDNLFKWAVPRVKADIPELKWAKLFVDWLQDILYDGKEPVTSLYERIQKVRSQ